MSIVDSVWIEVCNPKVTIKISNQVYSYNTTQAEIVNAFNLRWVFILTSMFNVTIMG